MASIQATHRYARISPTKVRHFANLVRGLTAQEGLDQLRFMHNRGARILEKVLKSAVANAEDRGARSAGGLVISDVQIDMGPKFRRVRPRGRGRADMLEKKFSHIRVALDAPEIA